MVERHEAEGYISANSIADIFYVTRKSLGGAVAFDVLRLIMRVFRVVGVAADEITSAIDYGMKDFEDALQVVCADKVRAAYFITRDSKGFEKVRKMKVLSPEKFIKDIA